MGGIARRLVAACTRGPLSPVAPVITIASPRIVLVKKAYMAAGHRLRVTFGVDCHFTGIGTVTCSAPANILMFDARGTALALPLILNAAQLNAGYVVLVEGATPSAGMNTTTFTLNLSPGGEPVHNNPATDSITCVEVQLDLCQYKPAAGGADPPPLSAAGKQLPGRNLHLQDDTLLYAGRALLIVRKAVPNAYTGAIVLTAVDRRVRTYAYGLEVPAAGQAREANPLSTPNNTIPAGGLKLWVEGRRASDTTLDTGFILGISHLPRREGDRVKITVIDAVLDVYQSRRAAAREPDVIADPSKMNPGRYVHLQDAGNHHGRAKVRVRHAVPNNFNGNMEVIVWDAPAASAANPRLQLMTTELPGTGVVRANPYVLAHNGAAFPAAGDSSWAQGALVSGGLRDTHVRLRVADAEGFADQGAFTVANLTRIRATIQPTPANTPANSATMVPVAPVPVVHVFDNGTAAGAAVASPYEESFASNVPLVMMRNGQPDVDLVLTAAPAGLPMLWDAIRRTVDHADLGGRGNIPTVTSTAAVTRATLECDSKGSFHIRPFIDCNGTAHYNEGEPSIVLNLILADARIMRRRDDRSAAHPGTLTSAIDGAGNVRAVNGGWGAGLAGAGMAMDLDVRVTGGGADGREGLDRIFAGLINVMDMCDLTAVYRDPGPPVLTPSLRCIWPSNKAAGGVAFSGSRLFRPGDPAPILFTMPLCDTGQIARGGMTAVMTRSNTLAPVNRPAGEAGQDWTIQCIDSPAFGFPGTHPANAAAVITDFRYNIDFRACFCFWTNVTGVEAAMGAAAPVDAVANRVYSVVRIDSWQVRGEWRITYPAGVPTMTERRRHRTLISTQRSISPIGRAQDHTMEVRPPTVVHNFAFDGQN